MPRYDYIIAGAGASGLSLLTRMIACGKFSDKKILLIDKAAKTTNDRTWCFWEKEQGFFEDIVYRSWDHLFFKSDSFSSSLNMGAYRYKMIRGIDFYERCFSVIAQHPNIDIRYGDLQFVNQVGSQSRMFIDNVELVIGDAVVFNSISRNPRSDKNTLKLMQHFKGWIIETNEKVFDTGAGTLMDFRVRQNYGTSFAYVMPLEANRALVEYTLFTEQLLAANEYDKELSDYIARFIDIKQYSISEVEYGIIPMTNARFPFYQNGIFNIGTAGGQTKASTGYTFQFIQKQSRQIVELLSNNQPLHKIVASPGRFHFYDSVLLQLLTQEKPAGKEIFTRLFRRNKASSIFKFLDNETSVSEELAIISTLQMAPFVKAAIQQLT